MNGVPWNVGGLTRLIDGLAEAVTPQPLYAPFDVRERFLERLDRIREAQERQEQAGAVLDLTAMSEAERIVYLDRHGEHGEALTRLREALARVRRPGEIGGMGNGEKG